MDKPPGFPSLDGMAPLSSDELCTLCLQLLQYVASRTMDEPAAGSAAPGAAAEARATVEAAGRQLRQADPGHSAQYVYRMAHMQEPGSRRLAALHRQALELAEAGKAHSVAVLSAVHLAFCLPEGGAGALGWSPAEAQGLLARGERCLALLRPWAPLAQLSMQRRLLASARREFLAACDGRSGQSSAPLDADYGDSASREQFTPVEELTCWGCGAVSFSLQRCSGCRAARYCSHRQACREGRVQ
ncbi:hypothetical protein ABPG75_011742 [Micractinium tetrahymenae]